MKNSLSKFKNLCINARGQSLVEFLVAIGISSLLLPALITGLVTTREGKPQQNLRVEAVALLKESEEVVRNVREKNWNEFANNGTFHPEINGNAWSLVSEQETINNTFIRKLDLSDVYRDDNGVIVTSGGTLDPSTKRVEITISWSQPFASVVKSTVFVTRYVQNTITQQTTVADFTSGTTSSTQVTNEQGGEITLGLNTKGKWCQPNLSLASIDLPDVPNAVWASEGNVYAATGDTALASQESFAHVLVTNSDPPTSALSGKFRGFKTYDVFGESGWGYIATSNDSKEVVIINLNQYDDLPNKILHEEGYFNTVNNSNNNVSSDATALFVMDNRGYVAAGSYLYVFDLASKSGSRPKIGSRIQFADSGDTAGEIYGRVVGGSTYIFVAIEGATPEELRIINVTNHLNSSQWRVVGEINIEPNNCSTLESGKAVYVKPDGTRAYISSSNDAAFKEFFTIDTSNKSSPSLVGGIATKPPCTNGGGYESGGLNPEQSVVVSTLENRALLVGVDATGDAINSEEYQVLDMTNEAAPIKCGGLQFDQGIYGVAAVREADGDAYAYIITGNTGSDLKIIQGGPDGTYLESGTYESSTLDLGASVVMNRISFNSSEPASTEVKFQVAATDAISGSCSGVSFSYVGPDSTGSTYFGTTGGALPFSDDGSGYENPAQCVRYKAFFSTTDYNSTPTLYDASINYSP